MGVVDGDVGMQGLYVGVLQLLYLQLVLHIGTVYRSPTELRIRSDPGLIPCPSHSLQIDTCPTQLLPLPPNSEARVSMPSIPAPPGRHVCTQTQTHAHRLLAGFPPSHSCAPAEKMLMAMSSANSASLSCSSFMALENSKMGLMNSTCSPGGGEKGG